MKKGICTALAVIVLAAAIPGCKSMGKQMTANPFPAGKKVFIKSGLYDLYGGEDQLGDSDTEKLWKITIMLEMNKKNYLFVEKREDADLEIILREGQTLEREISRGMNLKFFTYRIQINEISAQQSVFNKWEQIGTYFAGKKISDFNDRLTSFTIQALKDLP